jgi:predicted PurR-regulated permease PerM
VLLALALIVALRYVLMLLFLSIVVATALAPLAERLRRWGASQGISVLVAFGLLIALVGGIIAAVVPFFMGQVTQVIVDLPERYASVRQTIEASRSGLLRGLGAQLPVDPFQSITSDGGLALGAGLAPMLPLLARGLLVSALVLFLSYYWLYYRARAVQSVALLVPLDYRAEAIEVWNQIEV